MTLLGAVVLVVAALSASLWVLDLVRRGRLYVGYGIVVLALTAAATCMAVLPWPQRAATSLMDALFTSEPVAAIGISGIMVLLVYVLNQLSVLSDRVATLTQELAIRHASNQPHKPDPSAELKP